MSGKIDVLATLNALDPSVCDYEEWCNVGMAIHAEGLSVADWDAWSRRDPTRYHPGECEKKWKTFGRERGITAGTLAHIARSKGVKPAHVDDGDNYVFGWDMKEAVVPGEQIRIVNPEYTEPEDIPESTEIEPKNQLAKYLQALFKPGEFVNYTTEAYQDESGKWKPIGGISMERDKLLARLNDKKDLETALSSSLDANAGAWICANPLDGKGRKNENVTDFRYTLAESDELEPEAQLGIIRKMKLPCAAIVSSGGKSVHAIVRIDAENLHEYQERVDELHKILNGNGFKCDKQTKNPSRLSRMPGVKRGDKQQVLIDLNCGMQSWHEWYEWVQDLADDLPDIETWDDLADDLPELAPELIAGVLRQGHKMLVSGPSKVGKSWLLIELARAIATGTDWVGFDCKQGHVLYVNLEIDRASFLNRINDLDKHLAERFGRMDVKSRKNLHILNLRGHAASISTLAPRIIRKVQKTGLDVSAIIVDPLYKVMGNADENAAGDVAQFLNVFDHIAETVGCSMIYCHHFSKGAQDGKRTLDMASGSGVFGRDPDASLAIEPVRAEAPDDESSAWRVSFTLREFREPAPVTMWFKWPCHTVDEDIAELEREASEKRSEKASERNRSAASNAHENINGALRVAADRLAEQGQKTTLKNLLTMLPAKVNGGEVNEKKLRKWLNSNESPWCVAHYDKNLKIAIFDPSEDEMLSGF